MSQNLDDTILAGASWCFRFQIQGQPRCLLGPLQVLPLGHKGLSQVLAAPWSLGCEQLPLTGLSLCCSG